MDTVRIPVAEGVALHARTWAGEATPFLLVHGLASNLHLWDGVAERLAGAGHMVVSIDQRGHGRSDKPDDGYDHDTITADLAAVVDFSALDRPVMVGQSWGATVALELAARRPTLTRGVACVDGGVMDLRTRFPRWEDCAAAMAPPKLAGTPLERISRRLYEMHPEWPASGIEATLANFELREDGTVAPWLTFDRHMLILQCLWDDSPADLYDRVTVPTLLIPAEQPGRGMDEKRARVAKAERALATSRVQWMRGDHDLHAQHPEKVAAVLLDAVGDGFFPGPPQDTRTME